MTDEDREDYRRGPAPTTEPPPAKTDALIAAEQRAHAIAACQLCDQDGYRQQTVCDHTDRTTTHQHGIAAVRHAMGWTK